MKKETKPKTEKPKAVNGKKRKSVTLNVKASDVITEAMNQIEKLGKENKSLTVKYNEAIIDILDLKVELKSIKSKWWYKLFA